MSFKEIDFMDNIKMLYNGRIIISHTCFLVSSFDIMTASLDVMTLNVYLVLLAKQKIKMSKPLQKSALSGLGITDILPVYNQLLLCNHFHDSGNLKTKTTSKLRSLKRGLHWA